MNSNFFFENKGPFSLKKVVEVSGGRLASEKDVSIKIVNISDLFIFFNENTKLEKIEKIS